ncbi:MAG: hypothetical protein E7474_01115 [Ruminococcaceae bacterium]|nr:hypothetical protein [Oscillospiraceae bacterium]
MKIECVWEHNGSDSLLYACGFPGAFARGSSVEEALRKMPREIASYAAWANMAPDAPLDVVVVQEKASGLDVRDADSDVLFDTERSPLTESAYQSLKALAMKSAADFLALYRTFPDRDKTVLPARKTFYGDVPRTAEEMYLHTKNVNAYYWGEIGVDADNGGTIAECRARGFESLEQSGDFLSGGVFDGSWGEQWSLAKVLRRFLWHDRIHAKAMYRMGVQTFGADAVPNIFRF